MSLFLDPFHHVVHADDHGRWPVHSLARIRVRSVKSKSPSRRLTSRKKSRRRSRVTESHRRRPRRPRQLPSDIPIHPDWPTWSSEPLANIDQGSQPPAGRSKAIWRPCSGYRSQTITTDRMDRLSSSHSFKEGERKPSPTKGDVVLTDDWKYRIPTILTIDSAFIRILGNPMADANKTVLPIFFTSQLLALQSAGDGSLQSEP